MRNAVIITYNKYPNGDAGAVRQHAMAKILKELQYNVTVVCNGEYTGEKAKEYDGVSYVSMRGKSSNRIVRFRNYLSFGNRVVRWLKKHIAHIDVVLVVDLSPNSMCRVANYAKRKKCILIHDSVEWYSPEEFKHRKMDFEYLFKEFTNKVAINKKWNVIAISKFLEDHFLSKKIHTMRIPVIMDIDNIKSENQETVSKKKKIVYAGSPGKKDYLFEMIEGFSLLSNDEKAKTEFHIFGVNKNQLINECGVKKQLLDRTQDCLFAHGRVSREEVIRRVMDADFTILVRDETLRYAKAGFPTKIVESLACGIPPICNYSSDLKLYLKDCENAVVINGHDKESIANAISKAISLNDSELIVMKKNARKTAEMFFDYKQYYNLFDEFIKKAN